MTNDELIAIIGAHRKESLGHEDGELSNARARAMDHYHGRPYGNEQAGRSQIVSRDLMETVDWAMPALMRTFVQSGTIAEFDPVSEDDEEQARQESDYVLHVVMNQNKGALLVHDTLKEALLLKNCYAKHWWATEKTVRRESYTGLTIEGVQRLLEELQRDGAEVEIVGQDSQFIPMGNPAQQIMGNPAAAAGIELFDIRLKITRKESCLKVEAVPGEEIRVSKKCRGSLQESPFVEHITRKTRSELLEMGMDRSFVDSLPSYNERQNDSEVSARDTVTDESRYTGQMLVDRAMDEIEFCEAYIRCDYDGDGIAELRKVVTCANRIPPGEEWNAEIEACAITGGVIKRVPHRHVGESLDDELADLQEILTTLKRQMLDNVYATNNNQWLANERVNLKDLMSNLPGGIKRIRGDGPIGDSLLPVMVPSIVDKLLPVVDHFNTTKEVRSGIRPGSDMDPDILRESTKGAFMEHLNRASQKIELIARLYAESFLKELMTQVHGLLIRHQDVPRTVKLRGKWVPVNPQEWRDRSDVSVRVGLGTGNEEEKRGKLQMLMQAQGLLLKACTEAPPPIYEKMYAMFNDLAEAVGVALPDKYAIAPKSQEYQMLQQMPKPPNADMAKVQAEMQLNQARMQQEGQREQAKMQMQAQVDAHRQQVEAQQQQARLSMERELAAYKAQLDMQLAREKLAMQQQTELAIAKMRAEASIDVAQISAQTTLTAQQEEASDVAVEDTDDGNGMMGGMDD